MKKKANKLTPDGELTISGLYDTDGNNVIKYTEMIVKKLLEITKDDDFLNELSQNDNGTDFVHAILTTAPIVFLRTAYHDDFKDVDPIELHYIAQRLIYKYHTS